MGRKNKTFRGVLLKWVPTDCDCGLGAVLLRAKTPCRCTKVVRHPARNSTVRVPLERIDSTRIDEPGYLVGLAIAQRHEERRNSTAAAWAQAAEHVRQQQEQERRKRNNPVVIANTIKVPRDSPVPKKLSARQLGKPKRNFKVEYTAYIASPEWKAKRQEYIAAVNPTECPVCREPWGKGGHIHHKSYKHMGAEPLDDLVHLCEDCHDKIHLLYRKPRWHQRGLRETTDHVLRHGLSSSGRPIERPLNPVADIKGLSHKQVATLVAPPSGCLPPVRA